MIMKISKFIQNCKPGNVNKIKESISFPRFLKTLVFEQSEPVICVSHSLSTISLVKSLYELCSNEEFVRLENLPLFLDDTQDIDFSGMSKRILPVITEESIRWLVLSSSDRFLKMNEQEIERLATDFQLIVVTICVV